MRPETADGSDRHLTPRKSALTADELIVRLAGPLLAVTRKALCEADPLTLLRRPPAPSPWPANTRQSLRQPRLLERRRGPARATVGGDFDLRDLAVTRPGQAGNFVESRFS